MIPSTRRALLAAGAAFAAATSAAAAPATADAATLIGLTADNALLRIDSDSRRATGAPVRISGADGRVLGIDQRPQDGRLYGVTERGQIVALDPASGRATQVSRLTMPFESGGRAVVDFNPAANRLRLMGMNGTNFRVNVDTGEATRDGTLKYRMGGPEATPRVTAGAYTNSMQGAQQTALYTIDTLLGWLNLQAPPNDGVQQPQGMLGVSVPPGVAFDILADGQGGNWGFVLAGGMLHRIDLANGRLTALGAVAGLPPSEVIDIAAWR
jgi:Domain of unknown function (DUF4394)